MAETKTVRVVIEGQVQGVWYRGWTVEQATARSLAGWVRNRGDGAVEAVFSGAAGQVEAMVAACRRGPPAAQVLALTVTPDSSPPVAGFHLYPTV